MIENLTQLHEAFENYLITLPANEISAIETHLKKKNGKCDVWMAQRMKNLGEELSQDLEAQVFGTTNKPVPQENNLGSTTQLQLQSWKVRSEHLRKNYLKARNWNRR